MAHYEFLREVLGEDLYKQVAAKLEGNEKIKLANLADGRYVDKAKFEKLEEENNGLKGLMDNSKAEIENLKKSLGTGDVETKNKLAELQQKYDTDTKALNERIEKREFDFALSSALRESKAKNPKTEC